MITAGMALQPGYSANVMRRRFIPCSKPKLFSVHLSTNQSRIIRGIQKLSGCEASATVSTESPTEKKKPQEAGQGQVQAETNRMSANYTPSIWNDHFNSSSLDNQQILQMYTRELEGLKEEVRMMLVGTRNQATEKMKLIDTLERLGVSYHFKKEIEEQLETMFNSHKAAHEDDDLHTVAVQFRIFRQHGYSMPCGVFNKFKDKSDKFKETLTSDIRGLLSLYEATHVRTQDEDIREEALAFTTLHLKSMVPHLSHTLLKQVEHALEQPLHRSMERIEVRNYISIYQENESKNEILLRFAKIDFNLLQLLYKQELYELKRWWMDLDLVSKLGYVRDRSIECYFLFFGMNFEPYYAFARIMPAKILSMLSVIDDTYDSYGTLEELKVFTDAVEQWDMSIIDQLPDYMKTCYKALLNLFEEVEVEMMKQGRSYSVQYTKAMFKETVRGYYTEAKWFFEEHIPPFNEFMSNALITSAFLVNVYSSFMCMGETADVTTFDWLRSKPKILMAADAFCRYSDDRIDCEKEDRKGQPITGIESYMKEHGVSREEAINEFCTRMENAWKDMNEECLWPTSISMHLLAPIINHARVFEVGNKYIDGYNYPEKALKDHIISLFVDPIPI